MRRIKLSYFLFWFADNRVKSELIALGTNLAVNNKSEQLPAENNRSQSAYCVTSLKYLM